MLPRKQLLLAEGLTVGALVLGGVHFVGTHKDPVQRTVVLILAVIGTLLDGAFDALVGMTVHGIFLLLNDFGLSMPPDVKYNPERFSNLAFETIM